MKTYPIKIPGKHSKKTRGQSPLNKTLVPVLLFMFALAPSLPSGIASAQTAANLIGNPDLETTMLVPSIWNRGGFGENTASFSYPQTGVGGTRAVRVDMTAHASGDAKWYFDDAPVKPKTQYTFSDSSFSNVPTSIDIRYKIMTGGKSKFRYVKLGDVPAQSSATVKQFTFTTPANAVSLTIFHYIDRVGYLVTDNYSLIEGRTTPPPSTDSIAPTVSITSPIAGATVSSTTTISVNATDNVGVAGVSLMLDGVMVMTEDTVFPYSFEWNTVGVTNGTHLLAAKARDAAGNMATSSTVSVTVNNASSTTDMITPTVSITSPIDGATVSGMVTISANANDNVGVVGVSMVHSGTSHSDIPIGTEDTVSPYDFEWNTTLVANGVHMLQAKARDAAGNIGTSTMISVTVNNTASTTDTTMPTVSITSPIDGATVSGTTTISVTSADNVGVASNNLFIDGISTASLGTSSPATFDWNTVPLADGVHTLFAVAKDAAGNTATSSAVSVTVQNAVADTTLPTVSITSPIAGATVSSTTTISVNATDNVGVAGVSLMLDGVMVMTEDTVFPYSFEWNTVGVTNGTHLLAAKARDAAGNMATSTSVSVTVSN